MITKSLVDDKEYDSFMLSNEIKVLIIRNEKFTKTSYAISVKVGSLEDPANFPGLAHFLEHMLFMGTSEFPGEHQFNEFLGQYNGSTNAYTADEMTVYFCDVDSSQEKRLAEMFSSFFIFPLFIEDTVKRELSAVNSEYLDSLNNSEFRAEAILKEFVREDACEKKFTCGNDQTLKIDDGVLENVKKFYQEKYSSDLMNLVICGSSSLAELRNLANYFARIPNKHLKKQSEINFNFSEKTDFNVFQNEYFSRIIQYAPLNDEKKLYVYVLLPPLSRFFKVNPLAYIKSLLTNSESGSLLSQLKNKGYGFGIDLDYIYYERYTKVTIKVELTSKGSRKITNVLDMLRSSLANMQANEHEYSRLRRINYEEFSYLQNSEPIVLAEELAPAMYYFPIENILNFGYLFDNYDSQVIDYVISEISDCSKWIINLADKNGTFNKKELLYNVEYALMDKYNGFAPVKKTVDYTDKYKNDVFLNNIEIIREGGRYFKSEDFEHGKLFFFFDSEFNVPKSSIIVFIRSPDIVENFLALEIFLNLAEHHFNEKYCRMLQNYHVSIRFEVKNDRIMLKFEGFSAEIVNVVSLFISELQDISLDRLDVIMEETKDLYSQKVKSSPFERIREILASKVYSIPASEKCLEEIKKLKREDIKFLKKFYIEMVAIGNIKYESILELFKKIQPSTTKDNTKDLNKEYYLTSKIQTDFRSLNFTTFDENNNLMVHFYKMNDHYGANKRFIYADDLGNSNHQNGLEDVDSDLYKSYNFNTAVGRLIHNICHEDFFKELRTNEELGYVVFSQIMRMHSAEYLSFVVQSENAVEFLENRINKFIIDLKKNIVEMPDELFETFKESLIGFYEEPILNIEALESFVISQYHKPIFDLHYDSKMIEIVSKLTKDDLLNSGIFDEYAKMYSIKAH